MIDPDPTTPAACFKLTGEWDFTRRDELEAMLRPAESLDQVRLDFSEALLKCTDADRGYLCRWIPRWVDERVHVIGDDEVLPTQGC
jgi:hypothetical protein